MNMFTKMIRCGSKSNCLVLRASVNVNVKLFLSQVTIEEYPEPLGEACGGSFSEPS